ncbi:MAG: DUF2807 domain-containing protein [Henriciella sp.]|nr:DUF2807 domain-containing protein [Henriciella sp.]
MIRSILCAATVATFLSATAHAETRTYDVGNFTGIDVSAGLDVTFTAGGAQSISVENTKGDFSDILVEVKGDTLMLKRKKKNWGWGKKRLRYAITVSAPVLSSIDASSGSDITGSGLSGIEVSIDTSSGADATISDIDAVTVYLDSSSGSDLDASGKCTTVVAESSSGSDIDAGDLICRDGRAEASSCSDITIHTTDSVSADVSSGADVNVRGGPTDVDTDKSSGGSVNIRR